MPEDVTPTPPEAPAATDQTLPADGGSTQDAGAAQGAQTAPPTEPGFVPWQDSMPEEWRADLKDVASKEDAFAALKRGLNYNPATDIDGLVTTQPQGVEFDAGLNKAFRELGVKIGLTRDQAQALVDFEAEQLNAMARQQAEAATESLRKSWGVDFDKKAQQAGEAMLRIDKLMGNRLSAELGESGLKSSPALMEAFSIIGGMISEDTISGALGGTPGNGKQETAEEMFKGMFK